MQAVQQLELRFPALAKKNARETGNTNGKTYIALTYELTATCPSDIIELLKATGLLPDLKIIL